MQELAERQNKKKALQQHSNQMIQQHPAIHDTPTHSHHPQVYTIEKGGTMLYKDQHHQPSHSSHSSGKYGNIINPNIMVNDFALPQKSRQVSDKDSRSSSQKVYQLPTANMSISSSHSHSSNPENISGKYKKKRNNGINVSDVMNKMDENNE